MTEQLFSHNRDVTVVSSNMAPYVQARAMLEYMERYHKAFGTSAPQEFLDKWYPLVTGPVLLQVAESMYYVETPTPVDDITLRSLIRQANGEA